MTHGSRVLSLIITRNRIDELRSLARGDAIQQEEIFKLKTANLDTHHVYTSFLTMRIRDARNIGR